MSSANDLNQDSAGGIFAPLGPIQGLFNRVISVMNSAGSIWIFALMVLICADVLARALFSNPIKGVPEMVGYSIVGVVFLQLAHTLHVGKFTRAEMFIEPLTTRRPISALIYEILFALAGILAFALIANGALAKLIEAWPDLKFGVEGEFTMAVWPLRLIILIGAAMVILKYVFLLIGRLVYLAQIVKARRTESTKLPIRPFAILLLVGLGLAGYFVATGDLSRPVVGAISLLAVLIVIFLGVHIGVGLILVGFAGIWIVMGSPNVAINTVKLASNEFLRSYTFGVIPLFVLMGLLIAESDIGRDTFDVARWALRRVKGGLGVATVAANAVFAAITGSSIASAAVFTQVAAPHMIAHGYKPRFAVGVVAGSSILGMLIPPSLLLIIYGFVAEQSVGALFLAAVIPGIILAVAMSGMIIGMAHFMPSYVGQPSEDDATDLKIGKAAQLVFPIVLLVVAVMGGIYGGLFTPVEAGAVGAAGALIISTVKRRLTWAKLWRVLLDTGHTTVSVLFLILAANVFGRMLALTGLPQTTGGFMASLDISFLSFMILYVVLVVILGMFLESVSIMLILLPLVLPIVEAFGGDLVWFGIITVIAVEMGLLTPPLGIAVYVVKSTINDKSITLRDIFEGSFPFVAIMFVVTFLLILFPILTTWLL